MADELEDECLIVGLGNPGKKYEMTRHNMGFMAVQALAHEEEWNFKEEKRFHALVAKGKMGKTTVHLLMPMTYMNESGRAVRAFLDFYKLAPAQVYVVSDDAELEFGAMRLRPTGGSGGHNGLKSIEAHLGTKHYTRLRLGIGRDPEQRALIDFVLDPFSQQELTVLPEIMQKAVKALKLMITEDFAIAMQSVNARIKKEVKKEALESRPGEQKHE